MHLYCVGCWSGWGEPHYRLCNAMCDEIRIGLQWCDRIGDVRAALPGVEVIKSRHYEKLPPDDACLCGVDICATLTQAGCEYDHEPVSGRWVVF